MLAAAYMAITLDQSRGVRLPPRVRQQDEELEAAWHAGGGGGGAGAGAGVSEMARAIKKEDTLEDLMYWVGHLSEAYPEFADKVRVCNFVFMFHLDVFM